MSEIKVSVIVPVFNTEKYLRDCIESITCQTLREIEIICIDDGSTDCSLKILNEYKEKDQRIIVIKQTNKGAGAARNLGMSISRGKYLSFLDSDDIFEKNMLEKMYNKAEQLQLDIVVCRSDRFEYDIRNRIVCDWTIREYLLPRSSTFAAMDIKKSFFVSFVWWPWDKLYRRKYIQQIKICFQEIRTTNDLYFVCGAILLANRISYLNDILVHQRIGSPMSLSVTRERSWECFYLALKKLREFMIYHGIYKRFEQDFINYCLSFSIWHLTTLTDYSYCLLYEKLRNEWLENLTVVNRNADYFYNSKEYIILQHILTTDLAHHLFWKLQKKEQEYKQLDEYRIDLDNQIKFLRNSKTYKIGLLCTYIPSNIKKVIVNIKKNGLCNTMRKIKVKFIKG